MLEKKIIDLELYIVQYNVSFREMIRSGNILDSWEVWDKSPNFKQQDNFSVITVQ